MNTATIKAVQNFQKKYVSGAPFVLDIGSKCVNGSISGRELWKGSNYTGADIEAGTNVDVLLPEGDWDLGVRYSVVTSLCCLEHCQDPFWLTFTMAKHVAPGGFLLLVAPFAFHYHRYPIDCWRFTPDSMRILIERAGLTFVESYFSKLWPWQEKGLSWKFWNLWSLLRHQIGQVECVGIGQKER